MQKSVPNICILVAAHKPYAWPNNNLYLPIQVGQTISKNSFCEANDATGKNISDKNPIYCELTALYWAWKNLNADYIGLVHYRRHFKNPKGHKGNDVALLASADTNVITPKIIAKLQNTLSEPATRQLLRTTDVVLPKKRNYYIENLYDHYCKTMNPEPLEKVRSIIAEKHPKYLKAFDALKKRRSAHMFNMFIMKKEILEQYCDWLFSILFELEKQVDISSWSDFQKRYVGRISELLLDVWLDTNYIAYQEVPFVDIESINWFKKGIGFIQAKFFGRRYEKSW